MIINGIKIGFDQPPYIIAEIGAGHGGHFNNAVRMIELAKTAGASAVKLQVYTQEEMTLNSTRKDFMVQGGEWENENLWKLYGRAKTPHEWLPELFEAAKEEDITLFASVFGMKSLEVLEKHNCAAYKIASFENTHYPLIRELMALHKPLIVSTGVTTQEDLEYLVYDCLMMQHNIALLHCTSGYPTPVEQANLGRINQLRADYGHYHEIGYSDHTQGAVASVTALALGATILEKHMAFAGSDDATFGVRPYEFSDYVESVRGAHAAMQNPPRRASEDCETSSLQFQRSIYTTKPIKAGEIFTAENIAIVRPGYGTHPRHYESLVQNGQALADIEAHCPVNLETNARLDKGSE